ncbi:MAG: sensor domain-containing diguanylate cyclase [Gemmatimonadales bacterium]
MYLADQRGAFVDGNRALLDYLAVSSVAELREHSLAETFPDPGEWLQSVGSVEAGGGVWEFERAVRRLNGDDAWALDFGCVVLGGEDRERLYCGVLVDVTSHKEMEHELRGLIIRDPLTGCYNRRYLEQFGELHRARGRWGAIAIDIDDFKRFNDEHGHQEGDHALVQLTSFLHRSVRAEDAVVRMGGDEFLILLSGSSARYTTKVAERLRALAKNEAPIPFSLGKAIRYRGESLEQTLARADAKLLHVKVAGRKLRRRRGEAV